MGDSSKGNRGVCQYKWAASVIDAQENGEMTEAEAYVAGIATSWWKELFKALVDDFLASEG